MPKARKTEPAVIKLYARRRLYDAANGKYVSVDTLRRRAAEGLLFKVMDVETGDDVTRVLLA